MANKSSVAKNVADLLEFHAGNPRPRPAENIAISRFEIEDVFDTADARETFLIHREINWLGRQLRQCRIESGLTQAQLAAGAKVSRATIASIELGTLTDGPKVATLSRLFRVCGKRITPVLADIVRDERTGVSDEWETAMRHYRQAPSAADQHGGDANVVHYSDRKRPAE